MAECLDEFDELLSDHIFGIDLTDDVEEEESSVLEITEDIEAAGRSFDNVSKAQLVVVLSRISDRECNIPEEAIIAENVLNNIKEHEEKILSVLGTIKTSFSTFHDVRVKAKQERSIRVERNFVKDSPSRTRIQKKWEELVKACGSCANKNSNSVLEHLLLHFWVTNPDVKSKSVNKKPIFNAKNTAVPRLTDQNELEAIRYHGGWAVKRSRDLIKATADASSHIVLKESVNDSTEVLVDPQQSLELIKTLGTDERQGDKYIFVLHPEVTQFFVCLHDFTDSYFSVCSFDDQIIINCLKDMSISKEMRLAWATICKNAFPMAVQISVLQRVSTMFLKSKQQIIREKLNIKPQKGSVSLRQDIKRSKKKEKSRPKDTISSAPLNQTPDIVKKLQQNFENPEIVAECLREIGKVTDAHSYLNRLTGKQLTKLLRALGKPGLNGKGKAKQIAMLLPVITADTPMNLSVS